VAKGNSLLLLHNIFSGRGNQFTPIGTTFSDSQWEREPVYFYWYYLFRRTQLQMYFTKGKLQRRNWTYTLLIYRLKCAPLNHVEDLISYSLNKMIAPWLKSHWSTWSKSRRADFLSLRWNRLGFILSKENIFNLIKYCGLHWLEVRDKYFDVRSNELLSSTPLTPSKKLVTFDITLGSQ
jgi:hypothetical protein